MDKDFEILSAMMDGECTAEEYDYILERLCESEELRRTWNLYNGLANKLREEDFNFGYQPGYAETLLAITNSKFHSRRSVYLNERASVWSVLKNRILESFDNASVWVGSAAVAASVSAVVFFGVLSDVNETNQTIGQESQVVQAVGNTDAEQQSQLLVVQLDGDNKDELYALGRISNDSVAMFLQQ